MASLKIFPVPEETSMDDMADEVVDPFFDQEKVSSVFEQCIPSSFTTKISLTKPQLRSIEATLNKKDLLCILPTGSGKTFCMVWPPIIDSHVNNNARRISIIVSPLEALMEDMRLRIFRWGYGAIVIGAENVQNDAITNLSLPTTGPFFLIMSPEAILKIQNKEAFFKEIQPFSICIDEAHCVSMWGSASKKTKAFREAYGRLYVIRCYTTAPFSLLTATITTKMMQDIMKRTCLIQTNLVKIIEIPDRSNLYLELKEPTRDLELLRFLLFDLVEFGDKAEKTILFVNAAKDADPVFFWFFENLGKGNRTGKPNRLIGKYTASMADDTKKLTATAFADEKSPMRLLIATMAFGMGIDIPFIRNVVIWGLPSDPVICWQEIGRCGRDGGPGHIYIYPFASNTRFMQKEKFEIPKTECIRKTIISKFYGNENFEGIQPTSCQLQCQKCQCVCCRCCSTCRTLCQCRSMVVDTINLT